MVPDVRAVFHGIVPVLVVVVVVALWKLAHTVVRSPAGAAITTAALIALAMGVHELLVLAVGGAVGAVVRRSGRTGVRSVVLPIGWPFAVVPVGAATTVSLTSLFGVFLKAGALLFGSGYVLIAFLRADLVSRTGWLTESQLVDAIAVGQMTPGPVFTTATFVGYVLGGSAGALVATIAIFLPAFVYVALSGRLVPRLRQSPVAAGALDGVNAASLAMMGLVSWQLARVGLTDALTVVLAAAAVVVIAVWRVNPTWPIVAGGIAGWLGARFA